jgi:hypothetical protein
MQGACGSRAQDWLNLPPVSAGLRFHREDGGDVVLWNVWISPNYRASQPKTLYSSLISMDYSLSGQFKIRIN